MGNFSCSFRYVLASLQKPDNSFTKMAWGLTSSDPAVDANNLRKSIENRANSIILQKAAFNWLAVDLRSQHNIQVIYLNKKFTSGTANPLRVFVGVSPFDTAAAASNPDRRLCGNITASTAPDGVTVSLPCAMVGRYIHLINKGTPNAAGTAFTGGIVLFELDVYIQALRYQGD